MDNCIFCKIIKNEIPSFKVLEDDYSYAFLDIHPSSLGHTLVIPKEHKPDFYDLSSQSYQHLMEMVKKISAVIKKTYNPEKVGLVISGFEVPHTHVHIVPQYDPSGITLKHLPEIIDTEALKLELEKITKNL